MRTIDADGLRGLPRVPGSRGSTPALVDAGMGPHLETGAATDPPDDGRERSERVCCGVTGEGEHRG